MLADQRHTTHCGENGGEEASREPPQQLHARPLSTLPTREKVPQFGACPFASTILLDRPIKDTEIWPTHTRISPDNRGGFLQRSATRVEQGCKPSCCRVYGGIGD